MAKRIAPPGTFMDRALQQMSAQGRDPLALAKERAQDLSGQGNAPEAFWDRLSREVDQWMKNGTFTTTLPAHNAPPYWSLPLDLSASVTVPAAVADPNVWTTALTYTAPPGWFVRISGYGVNVRDATYTWNNSLIWRLMVNGNSVPQLANWGQQRGTISQPRDTFVLLRPDQTVLFQVRRDVTWGGASQVVEHCLVGYQYSPRTQVDGSRSSMVV